MDNVVKSIGEGFHYTEEYVRKINANNKYFVDSTYWTNAKFGRCLKTYADDVGKGVFERLAGHLPNYDDNGKYTSNCLWWLH